MILPLSKILVYELFSGVGFSNTLFSLETAIYFANILKRKLLLIVRYPLCDAGEHNWDFAHYLDLFSDKYKEYLNYGFQVLYGDTDEKEILTQVNSLIQNSFKPFNEIKFSEFVFYDKNDNNIDYDQLKKFCNFRTPFAIDYKEWLKYPSIYMHVSNASRCFYNFYTNAENYILMNNICKSLTILKKEFYQYYDTLNLPEKYNSIHLRFGDKQWDKKMIYFLRQAICSDDDDIWIQIDEHINKYFDTNLPFLIMTDRKDHPFFSKFFKNKKYIFTDDLIDREKVKNLFNNKSINVIEFLIQFLICCNSQKFMGSEQSTVSNYINYIHYINNKSSNLLINRIIKPASLKNYTWEENDFQGVTASYWAFFPENIIKKKENNTQLITLANKGYIDYIENLLYFMETCNFSEKLKIYCLDEECYEFFSKKYKNNTIELINNNQDLSEFITYVAPQQEDSEEKKRWAEIMKCKLLIINNELKNGNDTIYIDGDIVVFDNFINDLKIQISDFDLLIQNDEYPGWDKLCAGFLYFKSNEKNIKLTSKENLPNYPEWLNDQQFLRSIRHKLRYKYLDLNQYPNGQYWREFNPTNPKIIHYNHDVSIGKIMRMKSFNHWSSDKPKYKMKLKDWINYKIDKNDIIINNSSIDGKDSISFPHIGVQVDFLNFYNKYHDIQEFINNKNKNINLCLSAFNINTDDKRRGNQKLNRKIIMKNLHNKNFIENKSYDPINYFLEIGKYKFVIAPEGNGIDTHRCWETLYSKGIPIVEDNPIMREKCKDLPILWTNDYLELSEDFLKKKYQEMLEQEFDFKSLFLSYFGENIKNQILDKSEFWSIKRELIQIYNNYYTNNHQKLNKKIEFYGIPDHKGVPIDVKISSIINKPNGIFIDVGAFDGVKDSSTLHLEKYRNWIGILITPNKELAKKCKHHRPLVFIEEYACVPEHHNKNMIKGDFSNFYGSIDNQLSQSNTAQFAYAATLTQILDKNLLEFKSKYNKDLKKDIDLLKICTNMFNFESLCSLDFKKYSPYFIQIQIHIMEAQKIFLFLQEKKYVLLSNLTNFNKEDNPNWDEKTNIFLFKKNY